MGNPPCGESPKDMIYNFSHIFFGGEPRGKSKMFASEFHLLLTFPFLPAPVLAWPRPPRDCQEPYRSTLTVSTATVCELLQISKARSFCRAGSGWNWAIVGCHPTSQGFMDVYGFMSVELGLCWDEKRKGIELIGHTISYNLYWLNSKWSQVKSKSGRHAVHYGTMDHWNWDVGSSRLTG